MAEQSSYIWRFLFLVLFVAGSIVPAMAKPPDASQYPLRIHIFQTHWDKGGTYWGQGNGMANLYDGATVHAINFAYHCPVNYAVSVGSQAYMARWKKPEKTIELVGSKMGDASKVDTCEFTITLHDYVYDVQEGTLSMYTQEQYKMRMGSILPQSSSIDTNPAHYPLRIAILQVDWETPVNGLKAGSGRGNLRTGSAISSVDFTTSCNAAFGPTPADRYYAAMWIQEGSVLAMMLNGKDGGAAICVLKGNLHTDIYVRDAAGKVKAVSAEEYKAVSAVR